MNFPSMYMVSWLPHALGHLCPSTRRASDVSRVEGFVSIQATLKDEIWDPGPCLDPCFLDQLYLILSYFSYKFFGLERGGGESKLTALWQLLKANFLKEHKVLNPTCTLHRMNREAKFGMGILAQDPTPSLACNVVIYLPLPLLVHLLLSLYRWWPFCLGGCVSDPCTRWQSPSPVFRPLLSGQ